MSIKGHLRHAANRLIAPLGVKLVRSEAVQRQFLNSQEWHLRLAMQRRSIDLVLDIGANVGQFAADLLDHGYAGRIISVEPLLAAHAQLATAAASFPQWSIFERVALGAREGTVAMQIAGNSVSSSVLPMLRRHVEAAPESAVTGVEEVRQTTLDLAFAALVESGSVLIKIDTQGYEQQVLEGGAHCLTRASLVLLELSVVPLYEGQWLWMDAITYMQARGFELWFLHPDFFDPATGQVLQYNALFARV
jgi:FkbM family methyltransferase